MQASRETRSTRQRKHMSMNIAGELQGMLGAAAGGGILEVRAGLKPGGAARRTSAALEKFKGQAAPFVATPEGDDGAGSKGVLRKPSLNLGSGQGQGESDAV